MLNAQNYLLKSKIVSRIFKYEDMASLFKTLLEKNHEAQKRESEYIKSLNLTDEIDKSKDVIVQIEIFGKNGLYKITDDISKLTEINKEYIQKIVIDNSRIYQRSTSFLPQNNFRIVFDFTQPSCWDLISSPTKATDNDSAFEVLGTDKTWVEGVFSEINKDINEPKYKFWFRRFIHLANVYDLLLWLFFIPLFLISMLSYDVKISYYLRNHSGGLIVLFFLYFFGLFLVAFRLLFNSVRSIFSYLEYEPNKHVSKGVQNTIIKISGAIFLALVLTGISKSFFWLFELIKSSMRSIGS